MTKLKNPLLSLGAIGRLAKDITFARRHRADIAEKTPVVPDMRTLAQLSWRHMYQKGVALWHALSAAEKRDWETDGSIRHMTGFAWFMSQVLKPNPGLYLPLQGGTMAGDIDMDDNRILKLPLPVDTQEPLTLAFFNASIAPYIYTEGAKAYHNATHTIPNATWTIVPLNSEVYDTDTIHDNVVNNSRLTCKTAGKYLISFTAAFVTHAVGWRQFRLMHNTTLNLAAVGSDTSALTGFNQTLTTIKHLAVNDYVEAEVYQNSGAPLFLAYAAEHSAYLMMQRIGT